MICLKSPKSSEFALRKTKKHWSKVLNYI